MDAYSQAKVFSEKKLAELRSSLQDIVPPQEVVVTCGSYARREASESSDIDFFIITEADQSELTDDKADRISCCITSAALPTITLR
jgi:predicted nucleotidyltransferase